MSTCTDSLMSPQTEMAMRIAIKMEQIGSAIIQSKAHIKTGEKYGYNILYSRDSKFMLQFLPAETMTPTEPRVSANMCKKTPFMIWESLPP